MIKAVELIAEVQLHIHLQIKKVLNASQIAG